MIYTVKIEKQLSNMRYAEYILGVEEKHGESICSVEIAMCGEHSYAYDICRDVSRARELLQMLADGEVEPCHLRDIVCDLLPL